MRSIALLLATFALVSCGQSRNLPDEVDVARANAGTALTRADEAKEAVETLEGTVEELRTDLEAMEARVVELENRPGR